MSFSVAHEEAVKHTWLEKAEKSRQRRLSVSSDTLAQAATVSSEKKRGFRRRASLSLLELQKINEGSNAKPGVGELSKTFLTSLQEQPSQRRKSILDLAEDEKAEPIRIPLSVRFPPIHQLQPAKLSTRSFEKDAAFERKTSGEEIDPENLKYYIRNARRKSIA